MRDESLSQCVNHANLVSLRIAYSGNQRACKTDRQTDGARENENDDELEVRKVLRMSTYDFVRDNTSLVLFGKPLDVYYFPQPAIPLVLREISGWKLFSSPADSTKNIID